MFCLIIFLHECILVFYSGHSAAQNLSNNRQQFTLWNLYLIIFTQVSIYSLGKKQIKYIYVKIILKY